jgi:hypothetical protein
MLAAVHHFEGDPIKHLNRELANHIRGLESVHRSNTQKTDTQGGYHTDPEFINRDNPLITQFRNSILIPGIQQYLTQYYNMMAVPGVDIRAEHLTFKGWANIMRKGEWNAPHNHLTLHNRISAVYYIQVPDCPGSQGALQFDNPNPISILHGAHGNIKVYPTEGDLVIFPCYQMHFSHPFESDGERILIASDVRIKDQFDDIRNNNFNTLTIRNTPKIK